MGSVDDRVVSMKFDNKDFESRISSTLGWLSKLKDGLNFKDSTKNIEELSKTTKGFTLEGIGAAVDNISSKFSAMGVAAATVISNISTQALGMASRVGSAFTVGPIKDGLNEFETNMGSIQTILANTAEKGENLETVQAALDQLNEYSDKTIYNFGQMAKNIGTFTAAGVGLKDSVESVKGLANLAALTGTNNEDAARATYQLSQAVSAGKLTAQDWLSVTTAGGLGGEQFQKSLYETAVALKKLQVPIGTTFDQWKKMGGNFKEAMADGVFTSDVLKLSLQSFTGDLSEADLVSRGYSEAQAKAIVTTAGTATKAASDVKTLSQLMQTLKESLGTGWSTSFRFIFGNFEEAKTLFSSMFTVFGGLISRNAEVRNSNLQTWKKDGGRDAAIQAFRDVLSSIALILLSVQQAFRKAFPKKTGEELASMTKTFEKFTNALIPSENTLKIIGGVFGTIFSILSIGWTVVKEVVKAFASLFNVFKVFGAAGNAPADFIGSIGEKVGSLKKILVDDGGIANFFKRFMEPISNFLSNLSIGDKIDTVKSKFEEFKNFIVAFVDSLNLGEKMDAVVNKFVELRDALFKFAEVEIGPRLQPTIDALVKFKDSIIRVFSENISPSVDGLVKLFNRVTTAIFEIFNPSLFSQQADALAGSTGGLGEKFGWFHEILLKLGAAFKWIKEKVGELAAFFKELIPKVGDAIKTGDFSKVQAALNTGLLVALGLFIKKFLDKGLVGLLGGEFVEKLNKMFDGVTGALKGLQAELKADALKKIAEALLILAAALVVLSLIDGVALTKALAAAAIGFGQLAASFAVLNKAGGNDLKSAATMEATAASLIIIAGSLLVFALAIKVLGSLDPAELARGMGAVIILMEEIRRTIKGMGNPTDMLATGFGIYGIAKAILKLADAVTEFGGMDLKVLVQGMLAVGASLILITLAMKYLPEDSTIKALGISLLTLSLAALAKVVTIFGTMDLKVLAQGLIVIGASLLLLVGATQAMGSPERMLEVAAGLVIMSFSLFIIQKAVELFGKMDFDTMKNGLIGISVAIVALAIGTRLMEGSEAGSLALLVAAGALWVLSKTLEGINAIGLPGIIGALIVLGIAIAALAIGAGLIQDAGLGVAIAELGIALGILGLGLATFGLAAALFGAGIFLIVASFALLGTSGLEGLQKFVDGLPGIVTGIAKAVISFGKTFLEGTPELIGLFGKVLGALLQMIIDWAPTLGSAIGALTTAIATYFKDHSQEIVDAGYAIIVAFLTGMSSNIEQITTTVANIITSFITSMNTKVDPMIQAGSEMLVHFLDGIGNDAQPITDSASAMIQKWMDGIRNNVDPIVTGARLLIVQFLDSIAANLPYVIASGAGVIAAYINGIANNIGPIIEAGGALIINFLNGVTQQIPGIAKAVADLINAFLKGIDDNLPSIILSASNIIVTFLSGLADRLPFIIAAGAYLIVKFLDGIKDNLGPVANAVGDLIVEFIKQLQLQINKVIDAGINFVIDFMNGLSDSIEKNKDRFHEAFKRVGTNIVNGIIDGMSDVGGIAVEAIKHLAGNMLQGVKDIFLQRSPSRAMYDIAVNLVKGLTNGIDDDNTGVRSAENFGKDVLGKMTETLSKVSTVMENMGEFNPTITPVLDMTNIENGASKMSDLMGSPKLNATVSFDQAASLAVATKAQETTKAPEVVQPEPVVRDVNLTQINNSPTALTTSDIYRGTRSQITLAKEKLGAP